MKIASANLQMASSHASLQHREIRESLRISVSPPQSPVSSNSNISDAGKAASAADQAEHGAADGDPQLGLLRSMIELLTGRRIKLFDASALTAGSEAPNVQPPSPPQATEAAGYSIDYQYHESYAEIEETHFAASGIIKTADGREIAFDLELTMARAFFQESSFRLQAGDAARQTDPLVLNFAGNAAQLTDQRFAFDLDSDGASEQIHFAPPGSGFLALDRNGNGRIDNGGELFGPASGDGFQDLAVLDGDHNGWIDENDAAFAQLQVWQKDAAGNDSLSSLGELGVGAISLGRIATPFEVKSANNESFGQVRSSGIFLQEDGTAGTMQQIDLTA